MENNIKIYVEKHWVTGETCLFGVPTLRDYLKAKLYLESIRTEFINKLKARGFIVTFNKEEIDDDTICLIMDDTSLCDAKTTTNEYKKLFDQKIFSSSEHLNYPLSVTLKDYFDNPFFPAVFKNELTNGGEDKFLIENIEQLNLIKKFYDKNYYEYKEELDCVIAQEFIETPTKYATYLRVLVDGSGSILGASLKYSKKSNNNQNLNGTFEKIFLNRKSEYFINAKKMFNYYSNGGNIILGNKFDSSKDKYILKEHGIDPDNPRVPYEVQTVCANIMEHCNREIGILCGIDFMLNNRNGKWYYLENQAFPAIDEWALTNGINIPASNTLDGYLDYLTLELELREIALLKLVKKKHGKSLKRVLN